VPANAAGLDVDAIENYLAEKEAAVAAPLANIRAGNAIPSSDKEVLAEFIALQFTRTSRVWNEVHQLGDWYGKVWFQGISRRGVEERFREVGIEPAEDQVEAVLEFSRNLGEYRLVPPRGSFLLMFLQAYLGILPYLTHGWHWVVVHSKRPFLTSDDPVTLVGDAVDGGLGIANAQEVWLPVERNIAVVLTKDFSQSQVVAHLPDRHIRRLCQRIALESNRWLFWHPDDAAIDGIRAPRPKPRLKIRTVGWRDRGDGTIGELVNTRPYRPLIKGECAISGRLIVNHVTRLAPEWKTRPRQRRP
jgi:hypothetical protein